MRAGMRRHGWLAVAGLLLTAAGCATNPATGKRQLSLISESQEIAIGRQADQEIAGSLGLYDDPELQAYVESLGQRLAAASERPGLPWTFRVVDDPAVNAFALPGGFIYVTRGILAHMGSEAELVSVLGHEIGHVTGRHSVDQMSKAQLASLGLGVGAILSPEVAEYGQLAETGLGLLFLKYGRDDEREADELGLRYLRRAGYSARPMVELFRTLERVGEGQGGGRLPSWLSTHPEPADRARRVQAAIEGDPQTAEGTVERAGYLRRLDRLVFAEDPRQGYFIAERFLHPELRFELRFPAGWQTSNQPSAVLASSPERDAQLQLSLAPGSDAEAALRSFASQQGVEVLGRSRRVRQHGLRGVELDFQARSSSGALLRGRVRMLEHDGRAYRLVALAGSGAWNRREPVLGRALDSFSGLDDPRLLEVEPARIRVVELDRGLELEEYARRYPSSVDLQTLALLNQLEAGERLQPGLAKRVVGGRRP